MTSKTSTRRQFTAHLYDSHRAAYNETCQEARHHDPTCVDLAGMETMHNACYRSLANWQHNTGKPGQMTDLDAVMTEARMDAYADVLRQDLERQAAEIRLYITCAYLIRHELTDQRTTEAAYNIASAANLYKMCAALKAEAKFADAYRRATLDYFTRADNRALAVDVHTTMLRDQIAAANWFAALDTWDKIKAEHPNPSRKLAGIRCDISRTLRRLAVDANTITVEAMRETCPSCQTVALIGDTYCAECGTKVAA